MDRSAHTSRSSHVVVFAGGDTLSPHAGAFLPNDAIVIAADSGYAHAQTLGRRVDLLVGDFDSIEASQLADAEANGVTIARYPADKDASDLELALNHAYLLRPTSIVIAGSAGGRFDHVLGNVAVMASPAYADARVTGLFDSALVTVIHDSAALSGEPGMTVTLLPLFGDAVGVCTSGLRYALQAETLAAGSSRGVSNEFVHAHAVVSLARGSLVAIQPAALSSTTYEETQ